MEPFADNLTPVIKGNRLHPADKPFCYDPLYPCHEDQGEIAHLAHHVQEGHITPEEATDIVTGHTV